MEIHPSDPAVAMAAMVSLSVFMVCFFAQIVVLGEPVCFGSHKSRETGNRFNKLKSILYTYDHGMFSVVKPVFGGGCP